MRRRFTLVLKGHIAIATLRFPKGRAVWTSTGLRAARSGRRGWTTTTAPATASGSFLSVHEGPPTISRRGMDELEPGMILSNEPGYYREGEYGIRIENLLLVLPPEPVEGGEREMCASRR